MDSAGRGFDEDGCLVGEVLRHGVQLALVGYESERPTATGLLAIAGLQPGRYVATRQVDAVAPCARRRRRGRAARCHVPRSQGPAL